MYVCHCNGITDSDVAEARRSGAETPEAVKGHSGASSGCGTCHENLERLLGDTGDALVHGAGSLA